MTFLKVAKFLSSLIVLFAMVASIPAHPLILANKNSKSINYSLFGIVLGYTKGTLSRGATLDWHGTEFFHPKKVNIYAEGWTSTTGAWCWGVPVEGGRVEIYNKGFFRGVGCRRVG